MKISIYELLGLIKDGKAPKKIKVTGNIYEYDEELEFYYTKREKTNYRVLLGGLSEEINLIANVFDENVEILPDEENEFIDIEEYKEKLSLDSTFISGTELPIRRLVNENRDMISDLIKNQKKIINKLKEEGK